MLPLGDDPVLWVLGGLLACGLPALLIVPGIREIRRGGDGSQAGRA
jgi:hypothetical protein